MRYYPLFPERRAESLDGAWEFAWLGEGADVNSIKLEELDYNDRMAVPGVFDTGPKHYGKRGLCAYRKKLEFPVSENDTLRLRIGGLGLCAKIFWDGREIGECKLPYSSIDYDFNAGQGAYHEIVILLDNRYKKDDKSELLSPFFDFYGYGGIYRSMELQKLPETYIERVQVTTLDATEGKVRLKIFPGGKLASDLAVSVRFDSGEAIGYENLSVENGYAEIETQVPKFKVWSPESPDLHTVYVKTQADSIVERFGIRTVETKGRQILLNGEPLYLKGVNRHESHPELGPVQNTHIMLDDIKLIKELGCNYVRGAHYPQDQEFLNLCDETGLLVWQESLGWGNSEEYAQNSEFCELQVHQTELMVKNSVNHPSVILWGFLNECCSNKEGARNLYGSLAGVIKEVDPAFLVSYASNQTAASGERMDRCFDFADVISMNIYPGWIDSQDCFKEPTEWIENSVKEKATIAEREDLTDKPLILTEIGACGLYGCHDQALAQWSEEAQSAYFAEACRCVMANSRYTGITLWQMFDTRSYVNSGSVRTKPRGFNCAGLLDEYRRPKLAYRTVKDIFSATK